MKTGRATLDPPCTPDDELVIALLGLDRAISEVDEVVKALATPSPGATVRWSETHDAVLGLISVRVTLRLLVDSLCFPADEPASTPPAAWSRDLLR